MGESYKISTHNADVCPLVGRVELAIKLGTLGEVRFEFFEQPENMTAYSVGRAIIWLSCFFF